MKKIILLLCLSLQSFCVLASELGSLDEYEYKEEYESKTEEEEEEVFITLVSNDNDEFKISLEAARLSGLLKNILESDLDVQKISIPSIHSKTLSEVIKLCEAHIKNKSLDLSSLNIKEKLDLHQAIDYFLLESLYDFQRKMIFNLIVENSYEELEPYDIDFKSLLKNYFPVDFRRPIDFKAEVDGSDEYKILYYSIKYPFSVLELNHELRMAAMFGKLELVKKLIALGANIHSRCDDIQWTALMYAVENNSVEAVRVLIEYGARAADVLEDEYEYINDISEEMYQALLPQPARA